MTGIAAHIELAGLDGAKAMLKDLIALGEDLTPLMEAIGGAMADQTVLRFEAETAPDGTPWTPSRRAREQGGKTLNRSGRLRQSFDTPAAVAATPNAVIWGTNVVYAAVHQFGFSGNVAVSAHDRVIRQAFGKVLSPEILVRVGAHTRHMSLPSRPFVGFNADDAALIEEITAAFIEQRAGGAAP